jgi:glutamate synthase domain-containing protein 1
MKLMVTNGGPHPVDKWAEFTAERIMDLIQIPDDLISDWAAGAGVTLPAAGDYAVGMFFLPQDEDTRDVDFRRYHTPLATIEAMAGTDFLSKCYAWVMAQDDMNNSTAI